MSIVTIDDSYLTAIGNAIRAKNGSTTTYKPSEMAAAISALNVGADTLAQRLENTLTSYSYNGLGNTTFPEDPEGYLAGSAFAGCRNLTSVSLPNIKRVGDHAFNYTGLRTISLPSALEVGSMAFADCWNLESVSAPNAYISYVDNTFRNSNKLAFLDIYTCGGRSGYPAIGIPSITFYECPLITLILRQNTGIIPLQAISGLGPETSPIRQGIGYVYVTSTLVEAYKAADNWSTVANQIRAIEDYPEITGGAI